MVRGDLGIRDKRIAAIGNLSHAVARRTIDAGDKSVPLGFIETMGWNSYVLIEDPVSVGSKLQQGCTTMLVGEGQSEAPQNDATAKLIEARDPEKGDLAKLHGVFSVAEPAWHWDECYP